ncbi:putative transcriptional regulator, Crp/Fnr family protein [Calothrix sp. NIES-4071]|nr:putative transcriptional regulator, Crp/Fnr family protein [Calothrix sp. NIES-4071]BAZ64053.1 putative transcriptional regulator, Crp/Fnr family protein [Calothrix sp. NIES-4105]
MKSLTKQNLVFSRVRLFEKRTFLPQEVDFLWKVESGVVRSLTWLEDGTIVTLGVWGKGDTVGHAFSASEPYQIECITKVEAAAFPIKNWEPFVDVLFEHLQQAKELMVIRSYKTVDMMVMKLLIWFAQKFGREVETGRLIDLRLTHQDIAEILGTTRVTVTRVLTQLEEQGLIQRLPLHLTIVQVQDMWHYEI